jgi:hypothetical protein
LQLLHLHCLSLQLRIAAAIARSAAGARRLPAHKEFEMRVVETAATGVIAIASQILMVAAVLL